MDEERIINAEAEFMEIAQPMLMERIEPFVSTTLTPPADEPLAEIDLDAAAGEAALKMRINEVTWLRVTRYGEQVGFLNEQHIERALSIIDEAPFMSEELLAKVLPVATEMGTRSSDH
jgi:hypothetical protein